MIINKRKQYIDEAKFTKKKNLQMNENLLKKESFTEKESFINNNEIIIKILTKRI